NRTSRRRHEKWSSGQDGHELRESTLIPVVVPDLADPTVRESDHLHEVIQDPLRPAATRGPRDDGDTLVAREHVYDLQVVVVHVVLAHQVAEDRFDANERPG